jgi:glucose-6-phosphate 1-dehydrogenase
MINSSDKEGEPHLFVVFGGTGDLMARKLLPAIYRLSTEENEVGRIQILGSARSTDWTDESYREWAVKALEDAGYDPHETTRWCKEHLSFETINNSEEEDYRRLKSRIEKIEDEKDLPGNRAFYLGVPPQAFSLVTDRLGEVDLHQSPGWTRIVVEKPIGNDLKSVQTLNRKVQKYFTEEQIYRIDHYLGKETVRNLLVYRFANTVFESLWNRQFIDHVQITVSEDLGVGTRADFYDETGALRDMVQSHLTQLFTLITMEPPVDFQPESIRNEKIKVLNSVKPISRDDVVYGQYRQGMVEDNPVRGYREEQGVPDDTDTETFVAMKMEMNNWRWQGVPFYLRTGKRLPKKSTEIAVVFHKPPVSLFESTGGELSQDVLRIVVQPNEGFSLYMDLKSPGKPFSITNQPLDFRYDEVFEPLPDAYETLLLDVMKGDQTLFVRADEVEASWELYTPLLEDPPEPKPYAAGSWGPKESHELIEKDGRSWKTFQK